MTSSRFWRALTRRKVVDVAPSPATTASTSTADSSSSPLARVLTTFDLTALGVGSTLGVGVYVLAGSVARDFAGPAVIISFAVAAVASMLAGLCYAEFGARVPLAGSAYIYSYVSIGEFMAFVIGWNLIMEYVIGCASVARGLSNYLDQLMGNVMQESFEQVLHLHVSFLSPYIDFFAFSISFLLSVVLAFGVKESMSLNNLFTGVNMIVVLFVIVAGAFKADISNWQIDTSTLPVDVRGGQGGFFPFGMMGVLRGAATCFYGFIGFDCVATTGEEVKNPQRAIPIAIIVSLIIIFLSYFGVSAVLTLMWPYYLQDADAPLPYVFDKVGWPLAQWTVAIGGIFGLFASLFGAMYPLPRVIYAMANDGLIFRFLGEVHPKYKTPLVGTLLAGVITGIMAALFKLQQLVNMLSIGTLVAYTIVAACVLLLRYRYVVCETADVLGEEEAVSLLSDTERLTDDTYRCHESDDMGVAEYKETTNLVSLKDKPTFSKLLAQTFNPCGLKRPTAVTSRLVSIEVLLFCGLSVALGLCLVHMEYELMYGHWGPLSLVCVISSLLLIVLLSMALQPSSSRELAFKVPFVPVVPALSITLNIYLILMLDLYTWIRFMIWMAVGVGVYFIALACRQKNLCGSSPVVCAPVQAPIGPSTAPVLNGISKNSFTAVDSEVLGVDEKLNGQYLSKCNGCNIDVNIQCATPVPSESSDEGVGSMPSVEEIEQETVQKSSKHSTEEATGVREFGREESVGVDSDNYDENASITEVTNDLLSLTYENGLKIGSEGVNEFAVLNFSNLTKSNHSMRNWQGGESLNEADESPCISPKLAFKEDEPKIMEESNRKASLINHGISISMEDNETEEDVRSLYPDVVVISSSEEEINSRRSSIVDSMICTDIGSKDIVGSESPENSANVFGQVKNESLTGKSSPVLQNCMEENGNNHSGTSAPKAVTFSIFQSTENDSEAYISDAEPTDASPLENTSFVQKLEKIIGAQSLKVKSSSHPLLRKTMSLAQMTNTIGLENVSAYKNNPHELTSPPDCCEVSKVIPETKVSTEEKLSEDEVCGSEDGDVFSSGAIGDIKAKLERIFSASISSPITSPISKSNPMQLPELLDPPSTFAAKELYERNVIKSLNRSSSVDAAKILTGPTESKPDYSAEMNDTRRRMANVLGTIRLRATNSFPDT